MKSTPLYGLKYLESTDKARQLPEQSQSVAETIEAVLANQGQPPLDSDLTDLVTRLNALETRTADTGWTTVAALSSSFTTVSGMPVRYKRVGGVVYLSGQMYRSTAPTAETLAFTLPAGFRPGGDVYLGTVVPWTSFVHVGTDGTVKYQSTATRGSGLGFTLDGVSWAVA